MWSSSLWAPVEFLGEFIAQSEEWNTFDFIPIAAVVLSNKKSFSQSDKVLFTSTRLEKNVKNLCCVYTTTEKHAAD